MKIYEIINEREIEQRRIPASDKALRSLYMPHYYTKNLKGDKAIMWKGDPRHDKEGGTFKQGYAYSQTPSTDPTSAGPVIGGISRQQYKHPLGTQDAYKQTTHQDYTDSDNAGTPDTYRTGKVTSQFKSPTGVTQKQNVNPGSWDSEQKPVARPKPKLDTSKFKQYKSKADGWGRFKKAIGLGG